jgi:hypothetical protein
MTTTDEQRLQWGAQTRERLETVRELHSIVGERITKQAALDEGLRTAIETAGREALEESTARKSLADAVDDALRRAKLIALKLETAQLEGQVAVEAFRTVMAGAFPGGVGAIGPQAIDRRNALLRIGKAIEETPAADPSGTLRQSAQNGVQALEDTNAATKKEEADKTGALQALAETRTRWDEGYTASREILSGLLRDVGRRAELGGLFVDLGAPPAPARPKTG